MKKYQVVVRDGTFGVTSYTVDAACFCVFENGTWFYDKEPPTDDNQVVAYFPFVIAVILKNKDED